MKLNRLTLEVYSSGNALIVDPRNELLKAEGLKFDTGYPGGLYLGASFYVARDVVEWWEIKGAKRLVIRNGQKVVFEGEIDDLQSALSQTGQGIKVTDIGYWGALLMRRRWGKAWADDRITDATWKEQETGKNEYFLSDRNNRLHACPRETLFAANDYFAFRYSMPVTEHAVRITYDYDLFEAGGQNWSISCWRSNDIATPVWTMVSLLNGDSADSEIAATGNGAHDIDFDTPSRWVELRMYADANNNPNWNDHNHGEWSDVVIYGTEAVADTCLLYTSPSPRDVEESRMPSSA